MSISASAGTGVMLPITARDAFGVVWTGTVPYCIDGWDFAMVNGGTVPAVTVTVFTKNPVATVPLAKQYLALVMGRGGINPRAFDPTPVIHTSDGKRRFTDENRRSTSFGRVKVGRLVDYVFPILVKQSVRQVEALFEARSLPSPPV